MNSVTVLVFKYNAAAIFGLIAVSALTLLFLLFLLMSGGNFILFFFPVVIFIIYIRFAKKSPFKTRIVDDNSLTLSTAGIKYGDDFYPASEIEAVAIYLYAFENFEYRDGFVYGGQEQGPLLGRLVTRINFRFVGMAPCLILIFTWMTIVDFT
ncbi:MAG: hypothetical protein JST58_09675 [Bacteroidetes bacterium]|nr:hypothetical protein [Bacteroidota bacterium]